MNKFEELLEATFHGDEITVSRRGGTFKVANNDHVINIDWRSPRMFLIYELNHDLKRGRYSLLKWAESSDEAVHIIKQQLDLK